MFGSSAGVSNIWQRPTTSGIPGGALGGGAASLGGFYGGWNQQVQQVQQPAAYGGALGTASGVGITQMPSTASQVAAAFPPEVLSVVGRLQNPDMRSLHCLNELFTRLSYLTSSHPELIAFTLQEEPNETLCQEKQQQVEQACTALGNEQLLNKLNAVQKKNPNHRRYHAVPILGFEDLRSRAEMQQKNVEKVSQVLRDLHAKQLSLRDDLESRSIAKIAAIRQRHRKLQQQLIFVFGLLEDHAINSNLAQVDTGFMRKLEHDFIEFQDQLQEGIPQTRLFQLRDEIRSMSMQIQNDRYGVSSGGTGGTPQGLAAILSDRDIQKIFDLVEEQQEFYDVLKESIKDDGQLLENLQRVLSNLKATTAAGDFP